MSGKSYNEPVVLQIVAVRNYSNNRCRLLLSDGISLEKMRFMSMTLYKNYRKKRSYQFWILVWPLLKISQLYSFTN